MERFDFTLQGRRPTTAQIVKCWHDAGQPGTFSVAYGETFAEFDRSPGGRWFDGGNGCRGVQRDKVVAALTAASLAASGPHWLAR